MPTEKTDSHLSAFLKFLTLRLFVEKETKSDLDFLTRFDDPLGILWRLLSEEDRKEAAVIAYNAGLQDRVGNQKPWAVDLVARIEGLPGCMRRQEVFQVREWIDEKLRAAFKVSSLAKLSTQLGIPHQTIENYYENGFLRHDAAATLLIRINEDCRWVEAHGVLKELPMISLRFRCKPDDARKTRISKRKITT